MTDQLLGRLADVEQRLAAVEGLTVELNDAIPPISGDQPAPPAPTPADPGSSQRSGPRTRFDDPVAWVDRVLARLWASRHTWCPRWWDHADVYERVVWLWRSWEGAMSEQDAGASGAMANWLLAADLHREVLLAQSGPFSNCREQHGAPPSLLPVTDRTAGPGSTTPTPLDAERRFFAAQHPPDPDPGGLPGDEQ